MPSNRSVTEIARNFAEYIDRVSFRGERFVLTRGKKPVAELGPVPHGRRLGDLPALLSSLPRLSEQDAEDFEKDLEAAREELSRSEVRDPWES